MERGRPCPSQPSCRRSAFFQGVESAFGPGRCPSHFPPGSGDGGQQEVKPLCTISSSSFPVIEEGAGVVLCSGWVLRRHSVQPSSVGRERAWRRPRNGQDLPKGTQHIGGRVEVYAPASDSRTSHPTPMNVHSETLGPRVGRLGVSEDVSRPVLGLRGRAERLESSVSIPTIFMIFFHTCGISR